MQKILFVIILLFATYFNAGAQKILNLNDCIDLYSIGRYEEVYPSLNHIFNVLESDIKNKAKDYSVAALLISKIDFDVYNNGDHAEKILNKAFFNLYAKLGNSQQTRIMLTKLAECNRLLKRRANIKFCLEKAEELFLEAGDFGDDYLSLQAQKAIFYYMDSNKEKMEETKEKIITIYNKLHGDIFKTTDFNGLNLLGNIALIYFDLGDIDNAEKCYRYIIENLKIENVIENTFHSEMCNALSVILMQKRKWQEALETIRKIKWHQTVENDIYIQNLLMCALFLDDKTMIAKFFDLFNLTMLLKKTPMFFKMTEENRYQIWYNEIKNIEFYNFVALKSQISDIMRDSYIATSFFKTLSCNSGRFLKEFVFNSDDDKLKVNYQNCISLKHDLIFNKLDSVSKVNKLIQYEKNFDSVAAKVTKLSGKLLLKIESFGDMKGVLFDNEIAVEFCKIPDFTDYPNRTDYFGAYIIGNNFSIPKLIKIAKVKDIEDILTINDDEISFYNSLYSDNNTNNLYNLIFKELEPYLRYTKTVYYSPYGLLSNINFDILTDPSGRTLNQKYKMIRVSSTADIQSVKNRAIQYSKSASLFGNVNYDTAFCDNSRGYIFGNLKFSSKEIHQISEILTAHNITPTIYEDKSATEQSFKNLSGNSPEIIHLATHGFCFDTDEKVSQRPFAQSINSSTPKESAMALSGLALSGANNAWKGKFNTSDIEDGILTAYEISQLDLSNTKLVVLSACETARGRIFPVDGVFGLQRAFKQAGAGSILMSLWKVDDGVTATFMEYFYKFLFETSDRHEALKKAQDEVRKQYPDPYYWAAWVMLD